MKKIKSTILVSSLLAALSINSAASVEDIDANLSGEVQVKTQETDFFAKPGILLEEFVSKVRLWFEEKEIVETSEDTLTITASEESVPVTSSEDK